MAVWCSLQSHPRPGELASFGRAVDIKMIAAFGDQNDPDERPPKPTRLREYSGSSTHLTFEMPTILLVHQGELWSDRSLAAKQRIIAEMSHRMS